MLDTITTTIAESTESDFEVLTKKLKNTPTSHPGLNRLRAKINRDEENQVAITNYSRMHHRHNRT
jgi:hypothetical protein